MNSSVAVRLFLIGALLLGAFAGESAELIVNGDFESGDTGALFRLSGPASFTGLAADDIESYAFSLDTSATGIFAATYTFSLSDEDLSGAGTEILTLHLTGEVIPEPASAALVAAGVAGLLLRRRCHG